MTGYEYAGFWRRTAAFAIDAGFLFLCSGVLQVGGIALALLPSALASEAHIAMDVDWVTQLLAVFATLVAWVKFHGTPGKLLLGCYVVDAASGLRVTWKQAVLRYVGYFLAFLPLGLGVLWLAFDKRKRGWHDRLARTWVITSPARPFDDESTKTLAQLIEEAR